MNFHLSGLNLIAVWRANMMSKCFRLFFVMGCICYSMLIVPSPSHLAVIEPWVILNSSQSAFTDITIPRMPHISLLWEHWLSLDPGVSLCPRIWLPLLLPSIIHPAEPTLSSSTNDPSLTDLVVPSCMDWIMLNTSPLIVLLLSIVWCVWFILLMVSPSLPDPCNLNLPLGSSNTVQHVACGGILKASLI